MEILLLILFFIFLYFREKDVKESFDYSIPRNPYTKYKEYRNIIKNIDITFSTTLDNFPKKKLRYIADRADNLLFSPINYLPIDICPVSLDGMRYRNYSKQEFDKKYLQLGKYILSNDKISISPNWKKIGLSEKDRKIILRIDGSSEYSLDDLNEICSYDFIAGIELNLHSKDNALPNFIVKDIPINEQNELLKNKIKDIYNLPNFKNRHLIFGLGISYFVEDFMIRINSILHIDFIHIYKSDLSKDVLDDLEKIGKYLPTKSNIILHDDTMSFKKFAFVIYKHRISGGSFSVRNFKFHHKHLRYFIEDLSILKKKIGF